LFLLVISSHSLADSTELELWELSVTLSNVKRNIQLLISAECCVNCIFSWIRKASLQFEGAFAKVWALQKTWLQNVWNFRPYMHSSHCCDWSCFKV